MMNSWETLSDNHYEQEANCELSHEEDEVLSATHLAPPEKKLPAEFPSLAITLGDTNETFSEAMLHQRDETRSDKLKNETLAATSAEAEKLRETLDKVLLTKFRKILIDLDNDDYEVREAAFKKLAQEATLQDLVELSSGSLSVEQKARIERAIGRTARETWEQFLRNPREVSLDIQDARVGQALYKFAPEQLSVSWLSTWSHYQSMLEKPHTLDEYKHSLRQLDRLSAFYDWVEKAGTLEEVSQDLRESRKIFESHRSWQQAKIWSAAIHDRIAKGDSDVLNNNTSPAERASHSKQSIDNLSAIADKDSGMLDNRTYYLLVLQHLKNAPHDKEEYARFLSKLTEHILDSKRMANFYDDQRLILADMLVTHSRKSSDAAREELRQCGLKLGRLPESMAKDLDRVDNIYSKFNNLKELLRCTRILADAQLVDVEVLSRIRDKAKATAKLVNGGQEELADWEALLDAERTK
jgi:hypothetical protein